MTVHVQTLDDQVVIAIQGDFDIETAHQPYEAVVALFENGGRPASIVVDMTGVSFIDSTGLGGLVRLQHEAVQHGAAVQIRGLGPRMRGLFSMTGLDQEFTIEPV